jgi:hypothetical protein
MMKKILPVVCLFFLVVGLFVSGCGNTTPHQTSKPTLTTTTTAAVINAAGKFSGPCESSLAGPQKVTLTSQQNGTTLTGIYAAKNSQGEFTGTINGDTIEFKIVITSPASYSGNFTGTGKFITLDGKDCLIYNYKGSSNRGGDETGFGAIQRQ